jgi:hypothetical protein
MSGPVLVIEFAEAATRVAIRRLRDFLLGASAGCEKRVGTYDLTIHAANSYCGHRRDDAGRPATTEPRFSRSSAFATPRGRDQGHASPAVEITHTLAGSIPPDSTTKANVYMDGARLRTPRPAPAPDSRRAGRLGPFRSCHGAYGRRCVPQRRVVCTGVAGPAQGAVVNEMRLMPSLWPGL